MQNRGLRNLPKWYYFKCCALLCVCWKVKLGNALVVFPLGHLTDFAQADSLESWKKGVDTFQMSDLRHESYSETCFPCIRRIHCWDLLLWLHDIYWWKPVKAWNAENSINMLPRQVQGGIHEVKEVSVFNKSWGEFYRHLKQRSVWKWTMQAESSRIGYLYFSNYVVFFKVYTIKITHSCTLQAAQFEWKDCLGTDSLVKSGFV